MLKIIIPPLILSFLLPLIPEKKWLLLSEFFEGLIRRYFREEALKAGELLLRKLSELEAELLSKGALGCFELPQYKFYTSLSQRVLEYGRRYGSPLRSTLLELREALGKDLHFEGKIRKELWGGLVQFLLVGLVTWVFVFLSMGLLELQLAPRTMFLMMGLQGGGLLSYWVLFRSFRVKYFSYFPSVFSSFYSLLILSEAGLSVRLSLQESGVISLLGIREKRFDFLFARSRELLERWQSKGTPLKGELKELIYGARSLEEEAFQKFLKALAVSKFLILCLGFLSAYFVYLFSLFHVFLIE